MSDNRIDILSSQKDELRKQYEYHLNAIDKLKKDIDEINNKIENLCKHDWQKVCTFGGQTEYSCKLCTAYQC